MFTLRELEKSDIYIINQWRNDAEVIECLGAPFRYINLDVDIKWFETYMNNRNSQIRCAVLSDGKVIGLVSLLSIDYLNQSAELHIMIGNKENQNQGAGTFAIKTMLDHAFKNMNLQRIELTVLENNQRARHVYEKVGFVCEGVKRKAKFKAGEFVNMCVYALLKEEYKCGE